MSTLNVAVYSVKQKGTADATKPAEVVIFMTYKVRR